MGSEAILSAVAQLQHVWTFDDLQRLPDDVDSRGYEIVDGALVVSPSADTLHEIVSDELRAILRAAGRPAFRTFGPIAVDLDPSYLIPDLVVVPEPDAHTRMNPVLAALVRAVIEVVSPGSRTKDRVMKPALYAAAGIAVYLRVETEPVVSLTGYTLTDGASVYTELGSWGPNEVAHLDVPFPVDIPIDAITP
jgi:Uma2 family endonuclease